MYGVIYTGLDGAMWSVAVDTESEWQRIQNECSYYGLDFISWWHTR